MEQRGIYNAFISYSHATDGLLAPALQYSLHRVAKPWYRLRSLRVFLDQTNLSASPGLWDSIESALSHAQYFVLLASPMASTSSWVAREIDWWLKNRSSSTILIVLTSGEIFWNEVDRDFNWLITTALPRRLAGVFQQEPLYVDMRWAQQPKQLTVENSRFRQAVLDLAATLLRKSKDELDGEDVRQFRLTRRLATLATTVLAVLFMAASAAAWVAMRQRNAAVANESMALAALAETHYRDGRGSDALKLALASLPRSSTDRRPVVQRALIVLGQALGLRLEILPPLRHAGLVTQVRLSTDERHILSISESTDSRLWSTDTGQQIGPPLFDGEQIAFGDFNRDGNRVFAVSGNTVRIWDVATTRQIGLTMNHTGRVSAALFSWDGTRVVTASHDGTARLWDSQTGMPNGNPMLQGSEIIQLALSRDGSIVLTVDSDWRARLWNSADARPIGPSIELPSRGGEIVSATFSPDGARFLITAGNLADLRATLTGEQISAPLRNGYYDGLLGPSSFNHDGSQLITFGGDGAVYLWNGMTGEQMGSPFHHPGPVVMATFSSDGRRLIVSSANGTVRVWDISSRAEVGPDVQHDTALRASASNSDGSKIVTASLDGTIRLWDTSRGFVRYLNGTNLQNAVLASDGRTMAVVDDSGAVRIRRNRAPVTAESEVDYDEEVIEVAGIGFEREITVHTFANHDRWLIIGTRDGSIRFWDIHESRFAEFNDQHGDGLKFISVHPDGRQMITASDDLIKIWIMDDLSSAARMISTTSVLVNDLPENKTFIAVGFIDGRPVRLYEQDGVLQAKDVITGLAAGQAIRNDTAVYNSTISPDGSKLLIIGNDGRAQLWDFSSGVRVGLPLRRSPPWAQTPIVAGTFSPDGTRLVLVTEGGGAQVWNIAMPPGDLRTVACLLLPERRAGRPAIDTTDFANQHGVAISDPICGLPIR
ncbi:TIR domain-containing protein [Falsiroseomonas sp. HC035]|uniref:TIR domain-containing protein n=1 Tax=Falsiroseomonas sp. HC035 TaxID=3390999 RepID=UPI003D3177A2